MSEEVEEWLRPFVVETKCRACGAEIRRGEGRYVCGDVVVCLACGPTKLHGPFKP